MRKPAGALPAQAATSPVTVTTQKHHTPKQPEDPQRHERRLAGTVQQTEREWGQLIAMLDLAQRWQELIGEFTGEDAHPCSAAAASG
jgi:hypothetical protein